MNYFFKNNRNFQIKLIQLTVYGKTLIIELRIFCVFAVDKQIAAVCESDSQCTPDMACLNRRCINPCTVNPCSPNAECHIENHRRTCQCPHGYVGDPFINCYEGTVYFFSFLNISDHTFFISLPFTFTENIVLAECRINTECPSDKACINQLCQDPCSSNRCGLNAECITINHHPSCHCQHGLAGDPQAQCFKRKFLINSKNCHIASIKCIYKL